MTKSQKVFVALLVATAILNDLALTLKTSNLNSRLEDIEVEVYTKTFLK